MVNKRARFFRRRSKPVCRDSGNARILLIALAAGMVIAPPGIAQQQPDDLTKKSIEDLMNLEVTSASKKEQKISQVAAAIYVITQEDIRRSGATNIPDLLRMVPGLDVAQINANSWAISSRGFNLQFADKLLVLIDGRAVYTPLFGGVNWDTQDALVAGGGGTQAQEFGTLQYGGKIEQDTIYRVFAKYQDNNHLVDPNGQDGYDDWHLL